MRLAIEFSQDAERDFDLIFDHLFASYVAFGESADEAVDHAARRVRAIRVAADRLASFPPQGSARDDILPGVRIVSIARAIYWFVVDPTVRRVRILAVFLGGQDHTRHVLIRLLGSDEPR